MDKRITEIVREYNWERVRTAMVALEWTWQGSEQEDKVPSIGELMITAIDLLEKAKEEKETIATGGFVARYLGSFSDGYALSLSFNLDYVESYYYKTDIKGEPDGEPV